MEGITRLILDAGLLGVEKDDVAPTNLRVICSNGKKIAGDGWQDCSLKEKKESNVSSLKDFEQYSSNPTSCMEGFAVCAISFKIEVDQGHNFIS